MTDKIENFLISIKLFNRLLKIMIFNKKNKISFNKLILLADKEYHMSNNLRKTYNSFEKIASQDIHKKISSNYKSYKNKKNFKTKIKYLKTLFYWIKKLDDTKVIRNYNTFKNNIYEDIRVIIQERLNKIKDQEGQIEEDLRMLEDSPEILTIYLEEQANL